MLLPLVSFAFRISSTIFSKLGECNTLVLTLIMLLRKLDLRVGWNQVGLGQGEVCT